MHFEKRTCNITKFIFILWWMLMFSCAQKGGMDRFGGMATAVVTIIIWVHPLLFFGVIKYNGYYSLLLFWWCRGDRILARVVAVVFIWHRQISWGQQTSLYTMVKINLMKDQDVNLEADWESACFAPFKNHNSRFQKSSACAGQDCIFTHSSNAAAIIRGESCDLPAP